MKRIVRWMGVALLTPVLVACATSAALQPSPPSQTPAPLVVSLSTMDLPTLIKQAEAGDTDAQFTVAQRYERGVRTPRDYDAAFNWYGKAARAGHVPAQFFFGAMYASARGTPGNIPEALRWYRTAADAGYADAFYPMAYAYENGLGGYAKDYAQAMRWYTAAADTGNSFAHQRLANAYRNGELGLVRDEKLAGEWQAKASLSSRGQQITMPVGKQ